MRNIDALHEIKRHIDSFGDMYDEKKKSAFLDQCMSLADSFKTLDIGLCSKVARWDLTKESEILKIVETDIEKFLGSNETNESEYNRLKKILVNHWDLFMELEKGFSTTKQERAHKKSVVLNFNRLNLIARQWHEIRYREPPTDADLKLLLSDERMKTDKCIMTIMTKDKLPLTESGYAEAIGKLHELRRNAALEHLYGVRSKKVAFDLGK